MAPVWRRPGRTADRPDEDGAVAPVVTIVITILLLIAALVIDIGLQRVGRADMQALADVVSLDLARELDGRTVEALSGAGLTPGANPSLATASRDRNQSVIGYDAADPPDIRVELGDVVDGAFVDHSEDSGFQPSAVRVTATTSVAFLFGGVTGVGDGDADRQAVAEANGGACFAIGSYAARLDTDASPILGPLLAALGSSASLSVIDYNGLANADVDVADLLAADLGAGTIEDVLTGSVALGDFYLALASVLDGQDTAQVALLQRIAASVGPVQLALGDILGVSTGAGSGLDSSLNVLDLVTAAAAAANGTNGVDLDSLGLSLPPFADIVAEATAIEAPRVGCGRKNDPRASARSTQIEVNLSGNVTVPGALTVELALTGSIRVAHAEGRLTDVRCDPPGATVSVTDGLVEVDLALATTVRFGSTVVARAPITLTGTSDSNGDAVINIGADSDYDNPVSVGDGSGFPSLTMGGVDELELLPGLSPLVSTAVNAILAPVGGLAQFLVNGALGTVSEGVVPLVLEPLLSALGLDLSGADVFLRRVPVCALPRLVE